MKLDNAFVERVSVLLGHKSVRITEKHYSHWVRARQEQLEADLVKTWESDPVLVWWVRLRYTKKRNVETNIYSLA